MNFSPKRLTTLKILDIELAISSFQKAKYVPCILFLVKLKATNNKSNINANFMHRFDAFGGFSESLWSLLSGYVLKKSFYYWIETNWSLRLVHTIRFQGWVITWRHKSDCVNTLKVTLRCSFWKNFGIATNNSVLENESYEPGFRYESLGLGVPLNRTELNEFQ